MRVCLAILLFAGLAGPILAAGDSPRIVKSVVRADASGRLIRSTVIIPAVVRENIIAPRSLDSGPEPGPAVPPATRKPASFREAVDQIAEKHSLPPQLVHSVIRVESNYNPNAVSSKGALGLMQLVPGTARRFGVNNVFNPVENVEGGARYLRYLLDLYHNDYRLALAAYNAGEGAVAKHGGVPPYPETVNYIRQVAQKLAEARQQPQPPKQVEVKSEPVKVPAYNPIREVTSPDGRVRYISR